MTHDGIVETSAFNVQVQRTGWMQYFVIIFPLLTSAQKYAPSAYAQSVIRTIPIFIYRSACPLMMSQNIIVKGGSMNSNTFKTILLTFQSHCFSASSVGLNNNIK